MYPSKSLARSEAHHQPSSQRSIALLRHNLIPLTMPLQIHHPHPLQPFHNLANPLAKLSQPTTRQRFLRTTSSSHALRAANSGQAAEDVTLQALEQHFLDGV